MKDLVIIGAGGFGRELFSAAREAVGFGEQFRVKGFLDANPAALDRFTGYPSILGSPEDYAIQPDDVFITALGNIASRRRCVELIEKRGGAFISVIHRSASLGQNVTVDPGSFIAHNVVLTVDIAVGRHADIFHGTEIGHDSTVGDFAHVYSLCSIGGNRAHRAQPLHRRQRRRGHRQRGAAQRPRRDDGVRQPRRPEIDPFVKVLSAAQLPLGAGRCRACATPAEKAFPIDIMPQSFGWQPSTVPSRSPVYILSLGRYTRFVQPSAINFS